MSSQVRAIELVYTELDFDIGSFRKPLALLNNLSDLHGLDAMRSSNTPWT